jgi:hypothetical protein
MEGIDTYLLCHVLRLHLIAYPNRHIAINPLKVRLVQLGERLLVSLRGSPDEVSLIMHLTTPVS